jgi:hypothetical protein
VNPYRYRVSLRLHHPTRDLSDATAALELTPRRQWAHGSPRSAINGAPLPGTNDGSYWYSELVPGEARDSRTEDVEDALARFHDLHLAPHRAYLESIRSDGGWIEFYIGLFGSENFGIVFTSELLALMAPFGVRLSLDVYPSP